MKRRVGWLVAPAGWVLCNFVSKASAQTEAAPSESAAGGLIVFGIIATFWAVGGWLIYRGLKNRRLAQESLTWPTTQGRVLTSSIDSRRMRNHKTNTTTTYYTPRVRYAYSIGGQGYESEIVRFGSLESGSEKLARDISDRYPPGSEPAVRYDPANPGVATLETEGASAAQIWIGAILIALPLLVFAVLVVAFAMPTAP